MGALDGVTPELAKIFSGKQERRHKLASLPFPEKVQAVIQLQEMAATILRGRGKSVQPWRISHLRLKFPNKRRLSSSSIANSPPSNRGVRSEPEWH